MHEPIDPTSILRESRKMSNASNLTLPGSRRPSTTIEFGRSLSHEGTRHKVTINENREENPIDRYYEKNHYTVTGNNQETFNRLPKTFRTRFQVDKTDGFSRKSAFSSPGALGDDVVPTQRRFDKSFYWFAMNRKKFGFRYLALLFLVVLYTLFGATIFYLIEGTNERDVVKIREKNLDILLDDLANELSGAVNNPNITFTTKAMKDYIRKAYIDLQKQESQYKWSTYYRLEDPENNMKWTFSSAFFFSMNVYTTTGYGAISAETIAGQTFTMLYAFCFVPMTLVVLRDLGQLFLVKFTWIYAHALTWFRNMRGEKNVDEDEMIQLPIKFCMGILVVYLLFCTTFVYVYDAVSGPKWSDGLPYFTAFYFSFISLTTVGLGDVMPNNEPYSPLVSILFFIGMAVVKVVNRSTYIAVENGIFGIMTMVEQERRNNLINSFTVRSIATFMNSNQDVYGGGFGRVTLRRGDLQQLKNQARNNNNTVHGFRHHSTVRSISETLPKT
ncbi:unnamed protein product [Caenorhabditis angaria]|uniref:Potassium channel domain-containing protein n=1 Tax=Caenorhabditis angaria TaxID=860376 RepID=A0A9P1IUL2_9PELO|nr:unnamed protein product [Caenorhabditis angaria]